MREAAFDLVGPVDDATVLDLFAGSGALGLEALSRGAARCVFVERDAVRAAVIQRNLEKLRLTGAVVLLPGRAARVLREEGARGATLRPRPRATRRTRLGALEAPLAELLPALLAADGLVVVETAARIEPELPLDLVTTRRYGSARITIFSTMITRNLPRPYDPVTNGHVDVIRRAAAIFDRVVVGVVRDPHHKQTLFTVEERVAFLEERSRRSTTSSSTSSASSSSTSRASTTPRRWSRACA